MTVSSRPVRAQGRPRLLRPARCRGVPGLAGRGRARRGRRPRRVRGRPRRPHRRGRPLMLVNNEVGTVQPLDEVVALVREHAPRAVLHTDAVQGVPWLDVARGGRRSGSRGDLRPQVRWPEGRRRAGRATVGRRSSRWSRAVVRSAASAPARPTSPAPWRWPPRCAPPRESRDADGVRIAALRDRLVDGLLARGPRRLRERRPRSEGARERPRRASGASRRRRCSWCSTTNGVYAAAGSSCSSGATEPSHVLDAMGVPRADALASVRLSLGFASTAADVDAALAVVPRAVEQLRSAGVAA